MPSALVTSELYVKGLTQDVVRKIQRDLTLPNPKYQQAAVFSRAPQFVLDKIPRELNYYHMPAGDIIVVPRGYQLPPTVKLDKIRHNVTSVPCSFPKTVCTPRGWQSIVIAHWTKHSNELHYDYIAQADPGLGKTFCGLLVAALLKQKTLVVVHTQGILDSWITDAAKLFAGKLKIDVWKGAKSVKHSDAPITVAMLQTLRNADVMEYAEKFGLIILDEAHRAPASTAYRVISNSAARFRFGLTATPSRTDKLDVVIRFACGPVRTKAVPDKTAIVPLVLHKVITPFKVFKSGETYSQQSLWLRQMRNKQRVAAIVDMVSRIYDKNSAPILIVANRVELCEVLCHKLESRGYHVFHFKSENDIDARKEYFTSARKGDMPITVATTTMLSEGVNVPPWTHLIITQSFTAEGLVRQVIGRVERASPGKTEGFVWDLLDDDDICRSQYAKRRDVYDIVCKRHQTFKLHNVTGTWKMLTTAAQTKRR